MEFYEHLYVGKKIADKSEMIKTKLIKNEFVPFVHVILLPLTEDGILEIYPAYILRQPLYQKSTLKVVGIAADHSEACEMVQDIVNECLKTVGNIDLRNYLKF
ncbi:MAG: hypothetical protein SPF70_12280 [Lachnospiraceae bacterium]|nr:hypothetical protein [Lachnospiraceae bacterium]